MVVFDIVLEAVKLFELVLMPSSRQNVMTQDKKN